MKRFFSFFAFIAFSAVLISCSGRSSIPAVPTPNISGSWEIVAASNTYPGYSTGIEVALQEATAFENGNYQESGQISASSQQINFVGFTPTGGIVMGGNCTAASDVSGNSLSGNISGAGGTINFTYTENGNVFNVTGILDASGQSIDSGTYTEVAAQSGQTNGFCNGTDSVLDGGTVSGQIVPKLSGTYGGEICQPLDTTCSSAKDSASAVLSESGTTLTVGLTLSGSDDALLTLTGPVTGNAFLVQGTYQGQSVAYQGYYEPNTPSLYLVNVSNSLQPAYAGTLKIVLTP